GAAFVRVERFALAAHRACGPGHRHPAHRFLLRRPPRQLHHARIVAISGADAAIRHRPCLRRTVYAAARRQFRADLDWPSLLHLGYNPARTDDMTVYYAIGDVHGEKAKLDELLTH